ncbi:DinB family protein [Mycetocola sp. 2940]|uniref:DinB family protein n=1 Tax=Mycetocola sp. 2940 TaxID=3156452 RepID=UPI003396D9CC
MPIEPDTKNWTWVLERKCPECGFDAAGVSLADLPDVLRDNIASWPAVLARPDVNVRRDDSTWSPLEYGAHVRDVFRIFLGRLNLMLAEHDPEFVNWDQDATAVAARYADEDPKRVSDELVEAGTALADSFERLPAEAASRTGRRSDGSRFTVESLGRYLLHDVVHHRWDVRG